MGNIQNYDYKLSIAIGRLRQDKKYFSAGYDGMHERISFFEKNELHPLNTAQIEIF